MTIDALPTPPNSSNPSTFAVDMDTFLAAMPTFRTQANALAVAMTAVAAGGAVSLQYAFDSTTTDADPGAGKLRLDAATQNTTTTIRADLLGNDTSDYSGVLALLDDSTSTNKGYITLRHATTLTKWLVFSITSLASPAGYKNVTVTCVASSAASPFTNGDSLLLDFTPTGDKGDTGTTGPAFSGTLAQLNAAVTDADVQQALVSGTSIKTVNNISLLGSGDIALSTSVSYPQNIQTADYTLVLSDAGKHIYHPASDTAKRTFTIPANASVAFPIGTVIPVVNAPGAGKVIVAIISDTLRDLNSAIGAVLVPQGNILELLKVTTTEWVCRLANRDSIPQYAIAIAHATTPFVSAYPWSGSGFGTKFSDPATLPADTGNGVAFSPAGTAIAVAHAITPFVSAYPWSGSGFGTKFSNPATLPAGTSRGVAFSPAGTEIAVAHDITPFVSAYPWSGSGFGTKFSDPATLPTGNCNGVAFSPAGTEIAVAHTNTPFVSAYPWSAAGFGTKFSNPATLPPNTVYGVAFSPDGTEIAVANVVTPYVSAYPWSAAGFGTKFSNPATLPADSSYGVTFNTF